jgi:excisionase family DNA binding protein
MTTLLTTKQVQALLRVDRTTIYRMVEGGQLPAVRVGKQWRFASADVERWLQGGRHGSVVIPSAAGELGHKPAVIVAPSQFSLAEVLPLGCAQAVQDTFAELLGVSMVITDMDGGTVTQISNPCGYFNALLAGNPDGLEHCVHTWQQLAGYVALEPRFSRSEMGLMCARGLIRAGSELKGMVFVGGIAPDDWPPSAVQAVELAALFGVPAETVTANCDAVFRMDRAAQERTLRFVQRVADVFSHMVQDRLALVSQSSDLITLRGLSGGIAE